MKMSLIFVVALSALVNGASISRTTDSYQVADSNEDIRENLIRDDDMDDIQGLLPPLPEAKDYFNVPQQKIRESSYVIDNVNNTLKLIGSAKSEDEELSSDERDAIHDVAAAFEKLLQDAQNSRSDGSQPSIRPVVIVSDDGIAVQISSSEQSKETGSASSEVEVGTESTTYPYGETETFTTDVLPNDEPRVHSEDSFGGFFSSVWELVMSSVNYAADVLRGLASSDSAPTEGTISNETSTVPSTSASVSSAGALVALEESHSSSRLPSLEFEKGGRDIDSLLYGRGIA